MEAEVPFVNTKQFPSSSSTSLMPQPCGSFALYAVSEVVPKQCAFNYEIIGFTNLRQKPSIKRLMNKAAVDGS